MRSLIVLVGPQGAGKRTFIKSTNRQPERQAAAHETLQNLNRGCRYVKNPSEEKRFFSLTEMPLPIPRKDGYDHPARYWHVFAAWTQNNLSSRWPVRAKSSATPLLSPSSSGMVRGHRLPVEEYEEVRELPFADRERLVTYSRDWDVFAFRALDFFSDVSKLAFMSELWIWNAVRATALHEESLSKPRHNFYFPSVATRRFAQQQQQSSSREKLLASPPPSQLAADPGTTYFLDAFVEDCVGKAPRCYMYLHPAEQLFVPDKATQTLEHYSADPRGVRSSVFIVLNTRARYLYQCKMQPTGQDAARMAENRRLAIELCYRNSYKYAEVDALDPESVERLLTFVASSELKFVYHQRLAIRAARPIEARSASQSAIAQLNAVASADRVVEAMFVADRIPVQVQVCEIRDDADYVACDSTVQRELEERSRSKPDTTAVLSGVGYSPTLAPIPNDREPPSQPRAGDTILPKSNRQLDLQMNLWGEHCGGGSVHSAASPLSPDHESHCNVL